jgi:hypothetical protein
MLALLDFTASQDWLVWLLVALPVVGFFFPGCKCCCNYADTFNRANNSDIGSDWTVEDGTVSIDTNRLKVTSDTALIVWNTEASREGGIQSAAVHCIATSGRKVQLRVAYLDDENWVAFQVATGTGSPDGYVSIVECIAGVETETAQPKFADITINSTGNINPPHIRVTYEPAADESYATLSATLKTSVGGNAVEMDLQQQVAFTGGNKAAIAVVDGTGDVTFDMFCFPYIVTDDGAGNLTCGDYEVKPCGGDAPQNTIISDGIYKLDGSISVYRWPHNRFEPRMFSGRGGQFSGTPASGFIKVYVDWLDNANHHYAVMEWASGDTVITGYSVGAGTETPAFGPHTITGNQLLKSLGLSQCEDEFTITAEAPGGPYEFSFTSTPAGGVYVGSWVNFSLSSAFVSVGFLGNPDSPIDDGAGCTECP